MFFAASGKGRKRQKKGEKGRFRPISRKGGQTPLKPPFVTPPFAAAQFPQHFFRAACLQNETAPKSFNFKTKNGPKNDPKLPRKILSLVLLCRISHRHYFLKYFTANSRTKSNIFSRRESAGMATLTSRLSFPATEPRDPRRVSEGFEKGVSEGVSEGFSKGFRRVLG